MMLTMVGEGESVLRIPAFSKTFLLALNDNSRRLVSFWGMFGISSTNSLMFSLA